MKIKIKLNNSKFCEGCPCKNNDYEYGSSCNLDYWGEAEEVWMWINKITGISQKEYPEGNDPEGFKNKNWEVNEIRPQKCIEENEE